MPGGDVEVIIVSHDGERHLPAAIGSFLASDGVQPRVTVVDNASSDASREVASQAGATVVRLTENVGYGAAFNVGMRRSSAEWLVCANQDVVAEPGAVARLRETAFEAEGRHGAGCVLGPLLLEADGSVAETCHPLPSPSRLVGAFLVGETRAGARNRAVELDRPHVCGWLSGTCLLGRRAVFLDVGGFDERYFMYVEDVDLFSRLERRGHRCWWEPRARVTHLGGARAVDGALFAESLWNWSRFARDRWGRSGAAVVAGAAAAGTAGRAARWALRGARSPAAVPYARMFAGALPALARAAVRGRSPARPPGAPAPAVTSPG